MTYPAPTPQLNYSKALAQGRPGDIAFEDMPRVVLSGINQSSPLNFGLFVVADVSVPEVQTRDKSLLVPVKLPTTSAEITGQAALGVLLATQAKESGTDNLLPFYPAGFQNNVINRGGVIVAVEEPVDPTLGVFVRFAENVGGDEVQTITPSAVVASGSYQIGWQGNLSAVLQWNDNNATIAAAIGGITGIGAANVTVTGDLTTNIQVEFKNALGNAPQPLFTIANNTLMDASPAAVALTVAEVNEGGPDFAQKGSFRGDADPVSSAATCAQLPNCKWAQKSTFNPRQGINLAILLLDVKK